MQIFDSSFIMDFFVLILILKILHENNILITEFFGTSLNLCLTDLTLVPTLKGETEANTLRGWGSSGERRVGERMRGGRAGGVEVRQLGDEPTTEGVRR